MKNPILPPLVSNNPLTRGHEQYRIIEQQNKKLLETMIDLQGIITVKDVEIAALKEKNEYLKKKVERLEYDKELLRGMVEDLR